ncbi:IPT/TIG domain-containing protein [Mucilaginibacter sp. dw_454]|uniref:IPT/TIG domain-containing protein n=1 Tax=Mucilaginibacter sp. dw_454 TaxID=2720079 RepID=UPI001BD319E9|nr:IPT/TIG domain-containing protein [Mucilaginibacter sp. dw_454]
MIKKPLLKVGGLLLLIAVMGSCKKDTQAVTKPTTSTDATTNFAGVVAGRTITVNESSLSTTYYSSDGDAVKAMSTNVTLSTAQNDQLNFFINDVKTGTQTITKKLGTSSNPGNPSVRINSTGATPTTTQSYIKYSNEGQTYYAVSGTITITINDKNITVKWNIKFMNPISGEFPSTGSFTVINYAATTKDKSTIVDPTPLSNKPTIEVMTPTIGSPGDTVTIAGVNYSPSRVADNVFTFYGMTTPAKIISITETQMKILVPKQGGFTGAVSLKVKNSDVATGPVFTFTQPPTFASYAPAVAKIGDTVVIKGTNFSTTAANDIVKFKGIVAKVIAASATQISAVVPDKTTTGNITVTVGARTVASSVDLVIPTVLAWQPLGFTGAISTYNQTATLGTKTIFASGLKSNYLYLTTNGTAFNNVYDALPFSKTALEIRLVTANDSAFYITTNLGIAKSINGSTWTKLTPNTDNPNMGFTGIVAVGKTVNVINSNILYTSTDGGVSWTKSAIVSKAGLDYITSDAAGKYWFAVDATANTTGTTAKRFYRSTDQGKTWVITKGNTGYYLYGIGEQDFIRAHNSAGVFLIYAPPSASPAIADQRLFRSTNQGDSWSKVTDEAVYAVKTSGNEIMYGGLTFNLAKDGSNYTKYAAPAGYSIYGMEKSNGYYYIFCTSNANATGHKIFRAAIQ